MHLASTNAAVTDLQMGDPPEWPIDFGFSTRDYVKLRIMRGRVKVRPARICAACFVLLAQINFLWVSVLHRHEEGAPPARATALRGGDRWSQPLVATGPLCTACQIVRNSAARPTLGTPAPNPATSSPIRLIADPTESPFHVPYVAYGRAPPLS